MHWMQLRGDMIYKAHGAAISIKVIQTLANTGMFYDVLCCLKGVKENHTLQE